MLSSSGARTKESCKRGMGTRAGTGGAWGHGAVQGCDSPLQGRHPAAKAGCPKKLSSLIPSARGQKPGMVLEGARWGAGLTLPPGHMLGSQARSSPKAEGRG